MAPLFNQPFDQSSQLVKIIRLRKIYIVANATLFTWLQIRIAKDDHWEMLIKSATLADVMRQLDTLITLLGSADQQQVRGGEASVLDGTVRISLRLHMVATRHEQSLDALPGFVVGFDHQD